MHYAVSALVSEPKVSMLGSFVLFAGTCYLAVSFDVTGGYTNQPQQQNR